MWNEPSEQELEKLPKLYEIESVGLDEKVMQMHFFFGGSDWYVAEYDRKDRLFFGYAILNNNYQNAEWGYISYDELRSISVRGFEIDRDLHWKPEKASGIDKIVAAHEQQGKW